ncbi:NAD(P)/FAD-dependent oxidoreductase [Brevibacterium marinum]|uniref:Glycine/D-amino acid oxidase-like deaminating enzyme n=1 Tax=Brevibacterium marinum TaxID=418643 RepID=A0A846RUV6_9MICO|nr:FAD-binding oxidoreductase [Brevibacterium marinum]NJC55245.1 glycine/D-amino acid oxidase-like deaminating enzyme [Brevibacterium marinum]
MKTLVIGAGVLGLVTAWNLKKDGHEVTIVDKIGTYAGASHRSFAWINANHKLPESYHRLNAAGVEAHEDLQKELAAHGTWFHQLGCILSDSTSDAPVNYDARVQESTEFGYPVETIDRDRLLELEPEIDWPTDAALFFPKDGHLDNFTFGDLIRDLLAEAGVDIDVREVDNVESTSSATEVAFAEGGVESFDQVVIAAGAESGPIAQRSGLTLPVAPLDSPGPRTHSLLGITAPTEVALSRVVISDRINVRPRSDGSMFVQVPPVEHRTEEGESTELLDEIGTVMEESLQELFDTSIPVEEVIFSGRSFPEDGVSIVGYLDDAHRIYSLVTHSGMTLAPLLGRLVANELVGGKEELLEDFRPSRFRDGIVPEDTDNFIGRQ